MDFTLVRYRGCELDVGGLSKNSGTMSSFWGMNRYEHHLFCSDCFFLVCTSNKFCFFLWLDDQNASMKIRWEFCKVWWLVSIFCHRSHTQ